MSSDDSPAGLAGGVEGGAARPAASRLAEWAHAVAVGGLVLYAFFAPGSIAAAWIAISIAVCGWLARTLLTRRANLRRTPLDLPLWLLFAWTALSALLSAEPDISLRKLPAAATFLFFYIALAIPRARREVTAVACAMIAGAGVCTLWGVAELARGRGVLINAVTTSSPYSGAVELQPGDCVWRVAGRRVNSVAEIDEALRLAPTGTRPALSVIARGEHVELEGPVVTEEVKAAPSPSGLVGAGRSRRFRVSGWTRHYETFAETLQIAAQLALGFALAYWRRDSAGARRRALLFLAAFALLAGGIALTAMRTTLVAAAAGALVVAWRAMAAGAGTRLSTRRARLAVAGVVVCVLSLGALAVWRTRPEGALRLRDDSSRLRLEVGRAALARVPSRPVFGHGADAVRRHWAEWGFPGDVMVHTHSTPLQLAFDRGLPALAFWLWLLAAFWLTVTRAERLFRAGPDAPSHGLLLGAAGATAGFFASSLVNYNFGDAEVALMLWWLMGSVATMVSGEQSAVSSEQPVLGSRQ